MEYVSTNVRLPRELLKNLKLKAVEEEKSMGEVLRDILEKALASQNQKILSKKKEKKNPFTKIIGLGASGVSDGGVNHDYYLYGLPKNQWKK